MEESRSWVIGGGRRWPGAAISSKRPVPPWAGGGRGGGVPGGGQHAGIICTGETYKAVVKLTFAHGASLADPSGLFNSSLEGNMRRAIDIHQGDKLDERALKNLVRAAADFNQSKAKKKK